MHYIHKKEKGRRLSHYHTYVAEYIYFYLLSNIGKYCPKLLLNSLSVNVCKCKTNSHQDQMSFSFKCWSRPGAKVQGQSNMYTTRFPVSNKPSTQILSHQHTHQDQSILQIYGDVIWTVLKLHTFSFPTAFSHIHFCCAFSNCVAAGHKICL